MAEAAAEEGNKLEVHMEFDNPEQKEKFKAAFRGFVDDQQAAAAGRAGLTGTEKVGTEDPSSGLIRTYVNFIPRW